MKKKLKIFSPIHQQHAFLLYCHYVFLYDEIIFESSIHKNSKHLNNNIVDINLIKTIDENIFSKKFKYTIFFWNGEKQYFENLNKIKKIKKKLGNNLKLFFVGNVTNLKFVKFAKLSGKEKKINFTNVEMRHKLAFKYPFLFSLISIFKNIKFFLINNFKSKLCFTGLVKVDKKLINHLSKDWKFSKTSLKILKKISRLNSKNINNIKLKIFRSYLVSSFYLNLPVYEKYFMHQIIFRNLICNILIKNNNFFLQDWDNRTKIMDSNFFKNFIFLELGSTAGFDKIYYRTLLLKFFKKEYLRINFFEKSKKLNFKNSNIQMLSFINMLRNSKIENLNIDQLKNKLNSRT